MASATASAFLLLALLVASSPSLPQARTMPGGDDGVHRDQLSQDDSMTRSSAGAGPQSSPPADELLLLVERPPLPVSPPPPVTAVTPRSRMLGSVPSPGVGH
ncbi:hypothetical protein GUJ93_ZPchr0008g13112 [Zizania palustris]|uniref:Uncharacterized protein n=1 Tax=Zizania palustris TaxID=103762 RepID=A0A8J5RH21_ZIZPA|nr:hypothetical protein GUJ93_ZPchr0008g13112 [Zizania palustris]